jgi:hypothetical protein
MSWGGVLIEAACRDAALDSARRRDDDRCMPAIRPANAMNRTPYVDGQTRTIEIPDPDAVSRYVPRNA